MPLLKRKPYAPGVGLPPDLKHGEQVFVLRLTGEAFRAYGDYLAKMRLYQGRVWSCRYTGRTGLTYEEALREEAKATALLAKFPAECEEVAIRMVHHCSARLDELVNRVYEAFRPRAEGGKENEGADRVRHPLPRSVIRRWVQEVAVQERVEGRRSVWVAKGEWAAKYGLCREIPEALRRELVAGARPAGARAPGPESQQDSAIRRPESSQGDPNTHISRQSGREGGNGRSGLRPNSSTTQLAMPLRGATQGPASQGSRGNFRTGSMKYAAFQVLKYAGAEGATADEIIKQATEKNLRSEWGAGSRRTLLASLNQDKVFARTGMGRYALSALTGGLDLRVRRKSYLQQQGENGENVGPTGCQEASQGAPEGRVLEDGRFQVSEPGVSGLAGTCSSSGTGAPVAPDPIAMAEQVEARQAAVLKRAKAQLEHLKGKLKDLQRRMKEKEMEIKHHPGTPTKSQTPAQSERLKKDRVKSKTVLRKAVKLDEKAIKAVLEQIEEAKKQVGVETKAAAEAARNTRREKNKAEREAERARRKQEAQDAKRYPIDDLLLLEELQDKAKQWGQPAVPQDVHRPTAFSDVNSETTSRMLYVSDFLSEFGPRLHLRPVHFTELEAVLNGGMVGIDRFGTTKNGMDGGISLSTVYEKLLQHILDDLTEEGLGDRHERRLCYVNGPGTWPEVLRRFTLRSADKPDSAVPETTAAAAACLGSLDVNELETLQHLELLEFLCDEVLNTEKIRDTMQQRMDEIEDVSRAMRVTMGEEKRKLRELLDAEKEERKRKREQEAAAKRAAEEQTATKVSAGVSDEGGAPESKKAKTADPDSDSEEPCFDLPEDVREFKGDPTDRKALIAFRQQQQAEKRRLEKKRQRWEVEQHQMKKAREATMRSVLAEQQRKARQKADAEGAVTKTQEAYERVLDKYVIRRVPLGLDRHHRKYWWSLGGRKPVLYVEDTLGRWGSYSTMEELEKLLASLDTRGIREVELHKTLEKTLPRMAKAIKRAMCEQNRAVSNAERPPSREQPKREARKGMQSNGIAVTAEMHVSTPAQVEAAAINVSIQALKEIADLACSCKVKGPAGRWKAWREGVDALMTAGAHQLEAKRELRVHALQLEEALISGTEEEGRYYDMEEGEEGDEEGDEEKDSENCDRHSASSNDSAQQTGAGGIDGSAVASDSGSDLEGDCRGSSMRRATEVEEYLESDEEDGAPAWCVWRGARERRSWRLDTSSAATISHVAYCILALSETAVPALEKFKLRKKL